MVEHALKTAENMLKKKVQFWATDPTVWNSIIAPGNRSLKLRSYAFRLLSGCEAHCVESLCVEADTFPAKGFLVEFFVMERMLFEDT